MKKAYMKPTMQVLHLQHQHQLLAGSELDSVSSNLIDEEIIKIDETPEVIWGR